MYPYTKLMTKTLIVLLFVCHVKGLMCFDRVRKCCILTYDCPLARQRSWSSAYNDYQITSLLYLNRVASRVHSPLLCPTDRLSCLTFEYRSRSSVTLIVLLRQLGLPDKWLWAMPVVDDNSWSYASVPISNTNQAFTISINASFLHTEHYVEASLRDNSVDDGRQCLLLPEQARPITVTSTIQRTTIPTTKITSSTSSPATTSSTNNLRHDVTAVWEAERSDVTSPLTAVTVSVTMVMVVIVAVTVFVLIKRRQVCLYVKRLGTRGNHSEGCSKSDVSVDLADISHSSQPSTSYSAVKKTSHNTPQSPPDNASVNTSRDERVYQNIPSARFPVTSYKYVIGPEQPNVYNYLKEGDQSIQNSVGIYHVPQHEPEIDVTTENPSDKEAIYSLAQTSTMTSEQKVDISPYNALNLPGRAAVLPRDTGYHDVYNHLSEEKGTYNHVNPTRTTDVIDDEYSHIQLDDMSSET